MIREVKTRWSDQEKNAFVDRIAAGDLVAEAARAIGRPATSAGVLARHLKLEVAPRIREKAPTWAGGEWIHKSSGYVYAKPAIGSIAEPMCNQVGYVVKHRLVMAEHLGRPLLQTETVHHIDGDKLNNSIANLQLRQGKHGRGVVLACRSCGSTDLVHVPIAEPGP